ncbi:MAG: SpoIIE family protein phosphatase [Acidobacteriota bacterium]|nr:SpoIIE family protein phosphatase [Blastocatellia bacterium]MDW8239073.1 SpoIIE family protein phosphatase [Acidobacteriota bacterium]
MSVKILVVDDEPDLEALIRQRFRKKIQTQEFQFIFAYNGVEALEKLREHSGIDIVLTDINMPEMDGLTLLEKLSELDVLLKAVIVSAYGDMENIRTAMNRGAFDFLTKPIDFQDLDITIDKTLHELAVLKQAVQARDQLLTLQKELSVATSIQQSILPRTFPPFPHRQEVEIYAQMVPARQVGGDFYDFFLIDEERIGFVIADVSGKGVPAAIFMAMSRALLKATALTGVPAGECLRHVNRLLCRESDSGLFVTLFYGILRTPTGEVEYSIAGHSPPYLLGVRIAPVEYKGGMVLGVIEDNEYQVGRIVLQPGDGLFLYTDGVTEARDADQNFFSEHRLTEFLQRISDSSLPEMIQGVVGEVKNFSAGAPQTDDITILAIRYWGSVGHRDGSNHS